MRRIRVGQELVHTHKGSCANCHTIRPGDPERSVLVAVQPVPRVLRHHVPGQRVSDDGGHTVLTGTDVYLVRVSVLVAQDLGQRDAGVLAGFDLEDDGGAMPGVDPKLLVEAVFGGFDN